MGDWSGSASQADSWQSIVVNATRRSPPPPAPDRAEKVRLMDGRELVIRPITPADAAPIAASFHLLNEDEVRRRFLHILKALSEEHLRQLTHPDPKSEFAVVAAEPLPPGEALVVAVARLARDGNNGARAEFGILVSHFVIGVGIGRLLMQRLIEWSERNGVQALWGDVMDDNTAMLELANRLGFHRESIPGSQGLVRISLHLQDKRR
jgi:GNAT superfamily N-acetyltransferase